VCRVPGLPLIQILTHIGHRRHIRRLRLICATKKKIRSECSRASDSPKPNRETNRTLQREVAEGADGDALDEVAEVFGDAVPLELGGVGLRRGGGRDGRERGDGRDRGHGEVGGEVLDLAGEEVGVLGGLGGDLPRLGCGVGENLLGLLRCLRDQRGGALGRLGRQLLRPLRRLAGEGPGPLPEIH
jgi:hypothetical protein